MNKILVDVIEVATNRTVKMKLPDDQPVSELIKHIAGALGITSAAAEYQLMYKTPNPPAAFQFNGNDTLGSRGVKDGATLTFAPSFIAG